MHPRDGVVVVVNVRNGLHQKVAGKVGWPENWWPTLVGLSRLGNPNSHLGAQLFNGVRFQSCLSYDT
jgi:hypothetical protein